MAGLEVSENRYNPSALAAGADLVTPIRPAVDQNAVKEFLDAFRTGQVTANDFIDRYGELAQAKKIAGVQGLHEFISPEAIESRRASVKNEGARAATESSLLPDQAKLSALELKMKHAELLNPAVKAFTEYAPLFGQKTPLNADGSPNVDEMARLGSAMKQKIFAQQAKVAAGTPKSIDKVNDTLVPIDQFGGPVSQERQRVAREAAFTVPSLDNLISPKTGQFQTGAAPMSPPQTFGIGDEGLISPKGAPAPASSPAEGRVIQNADGSLTVPAAKSPMTQDQRTKLQDKASAVSEIELALRNAMGAIDRGNVVGPVKGSPVVKTASNFLTSISGLNAQDFSDRRAIEQLVANKVLDKSSLLRPVSDKDLDFLKAGVPTMQDTPERWKEFNAVWTRTIENTKKNLSTELGIPAKDLFTDIPAQESAGPKGASSDGATGGGVVKNVGGVLWRRNADGSYENLGPAK